MFIIACNTKYAGSGMKVAPRAEIADGKIDVVALRNGSRKQMLSLLAKVFDGSHLSVEGLQYRQVRSFAIVSDGRETLDIDGEIKGAAPVYAEMMPGTIRVFA